MAFKEVSPRELQFNPFSKIGSQWMLITAGTMESFNTMTASWGGVGVIWGQDVATCYIRPQRRTKAFVDGAETLTLSFVTADHREALNLLGSVSGNDDPAKVEKTDLTPFAVDGSVAFEESDLVLVCRKLYAQDLAPEYFTASESDAKWYPQKDYHTMYIGAIEKCLVKE